MDSIKQWLDENVMPNIYKLTNSRFLKIIMNAFMGISALSIAGSIFTLVLSLPLGDGYTAFLQNTGLYDLLNLPINITTNLISLYLAFSMGFAMAEAYGEKPLSVGLIALGSFLLLTPTSAPVTILNEAGEQVTGVATGVYSLTYFGATGIFGAMIVSLVSSRLYIWLSQKGIKLKMPETVPANVSAMFEAIIPGGIVFIAMMLVTVLVSMTPYSCLHELIYALIQAPFMSVGGGLGGAITFVILSTWLWMFGIHGGMVAYSVFAVVYQTAMVENMSAFAAGTPAPYPYWGLGPWYLIGGTGCTLALVLLMLARGKSEQSKMLGKLGLPCGIFGINEPIIFGCPVIMNPSLALPFCIVPLVNYFLTLLVMNIGLVPWPTGAGINSFMPAVIYGALQNGSIMGGIWTVALLALDIVLWYPFFTRWDAQLCEAEQANAA